MKGDEMKETDVDQYRTLLIAKRKEIVSKSHRREDLWIVQSNELIEMVQLAGQRELAARALEREAKSLMQIGAALKRIEYGEFGICLNCDETISPKRLAAVPWTAYCLHCQESRDAQERPDTVRMKLAA
jgi:DnaK suppressor protein